MGQFTKYVTSVSLIVPSNPFGATYGSGKLESFLEEDVLSRPNYHPTIVGS